MIIISSFGFAFRLSSRLPFARGSWACDMVRGGRYAGSGWWIVPGLVALWPSPQHRSWLGCWCSLAHCCFIAWEYETRLVFLGLPDEDEPSDASICCLCLTSPSICVLGWYSSCVCSVCMACLGCLDVCVGSYHFC